MASSARVLAAAMASLVVLMLLLFMPGGASAAGTVVPSIDATRTRHLPLPRGLLRGPESVAFDAKGQGPYSGVSDGRVLRWNGDKVGWTTYTYSPGYSSEACTASILRPETATESQCGRPLGLRFHLKSGYLYVADAYKGLMRVAPGGGEATVLVTEVDGAPLRFTNGVDVDQVTGEAGITYPNGLAISADRTHLVISSTGPCKLLRYWVKGLKAGTIELFTDLPSYPDNVRPDKRGGYWVALHREKTELPFGVDSHLLALRINIDGEIVEEMRGPKSVRPTEVVERKGGRLFMGSVELPYVAVVKRTCHGCENNGSGEHMKHPKDASEYTGGHVRDTCFLPAPGLPPMEYPVGDEDELHRAEEARLRAELTAYEDASFFEKFKGPHPGPFLVREPLVETEEMRQLWLALDGA
ncbi:protein STRICTOSIDINE SYNTHASE-LIKE 10-like [Lolium rigidum]|uniref:protein STRICTOSIDINE SYNTHASE-LIKE 10-like n=1 Tax=Lolium rigidum TaxID=89674 RepID=UPI001F5C3FE8|nr:protein STRICTOSIDINE SYNTHASE-LIKE 10-like [Lolium rigidum]